MQNKNNLLNQLQSLSRCAIRLRRRLNQYFHCRFRPKAAPPDKREANFTSARKRPRQQRAVTRQSDFLFILVLVYGMLVSCSAPHQDISQAQNALQTFFAALEQGNYAGAVERFGGSYEVLVEAFPDVPAGDYADLFERGCTSKSLICLTVRITDFNELNWRGEYIFTVQFDAPDGSLYLQEACCGENPDTPPLFQFEYRVVRNGAGIFQVLDLPVIPSALLSSDRPATTEGALTTASLNQNTVHLGMPWADFSLLFDPEVWDLVEFQVEPAGLQALHHRRLPGECRIIPNIPVGLGQGWTVAEGQASLAGKDLRTRAFSENGTLIFVVFTGFVRSFQDGSVEVHFEDHAEECLQAAVVLFETTEVILP